MFEVAVAYLVYGIYAVVALVGLTCVAVGLIVHRRGHRGRALTTVGALIALLPVAMIAASYLPGQQ